MLTSVDVCAQTDLRLRRAADVAPALRSAAAARYEALLEQELRVSQSAAATADDFRVVINRYWSFVRRYPSSGFADNALWQAAHLSAEAFERFSQERDKYPRRAAVSMAARSVPAQPASGQEPLRRSQQLETMAATAPAAAPAAAPAVADTVIRAVHREVLPEVVRVTRRARSRSAVLSGAHRRARSPVFRSERHEDRAVARRCDVPLRLGHRPAHSSRPAPEQHDPRRAGSGERGRYSVFTLYNPYRIVIDAERAPVRCPDRAAPRPWAHEASRQSLRHRSRGCLDCASGAGGHLIPNSQIAPVAPNTPFACRAHARVVPVAPMALRSRTLPVLAMAPVATIARTAIVLPAAPVSRNATARAVPTCRLRRLRLLLLSERCSQRTRTCRAMHPLHPPPRRHRKPLRRTSPGDCRQTHPAVGELERQVFGGAPAGPRRVAHRHRCRSWRPRPWCVGLWHLRSGARARRRAAAREAAPAAARRRGRPDAADERLRLARRADGNRQPRIGGSVPVDPCQRQRERHSRAASRPIS